jgi:hypothetical protein
VLGRAVTFALVGLEPRRVEVEAHLRSGEQPSFSIVGLADHACQEAKHAGRGFDAAEAGNSPAPGPLQRYDWAEELLAPIPLAA